MVSSRVSQVHDERDLLVVQQKMVSGTHNLWVSLCRSCSKECPGILFESDWLQKRLCTTTLEGVYRCK